jgi:LCP family protein required for cell wall assembly
MPGPLGWKGLAGKAAYGAGCAAAAVVLVVSGVGYYAKKAAENIGTSPVLAGGPSTGAMNILVMGLESRTYWDGTEIDHHLRHLLSTGSVGGEQTNTLMLIHVFAGGQRAVGFSIARDDYVTLYGTLGYAGTPRQNKIDDAYNAAFQQEMINDGKAHPGWTSAQDNLDANQAGQQATVDTVEALTGVTIDKFAEVNLIGFYELASAFGGVEVCVNRWPGGQGVGPGGNLSDPVTYNSAEGQDAGSGFEGKAGLSYLNPVQTMEFTRQRHNLPLGDIDRTYRQQAVLDYVLYQLRSEGALSDVRKLSPLLSVAKTYLQASAGWNLLQFAGEIGALTPGKLSLSTLPSTPGRNVPGIGFVNDVDVPTIQRIVQQAFNAQPDGIATPAPTGNAGGGGADGSRVGSSSATSSQAGPGKPAAAKPGVGNPGATGKAPAKPAAATPPASSITVDVYNSSQTPHLASGLSQALVKQGYKAGIAASSPAAVPLTVITYGAGASASAAAIASQFGLTATASSTVAAGHVRVVLGGSVTFLPTSFGGKAPAPTATAAVPAAQQAGSSGKSATALEKEAKARYGIPCEY